MGELVFPIMKTIRLYAVVKVIFKGFIAKNSSEAVSGTVEKLVFYNIGQNSLYC